MQTHSTIMIQCLLCVKGKEKYKIKQKMQTILIYFDRILILSEFHIYW